MHLHIIKTMITEKEVLDLMKSSETFRVEKTVSVTNIDKFSEAICAFSNDMPDCRKPGYLLIGVNDDGTLCGLKSTDELMQRLASLRTNGNILPMPSMTVQPFSFEVGDVIVIEVLPSQLPPVRYKGRTCIRIGPRKDYATPVEEEQLAEKKQLYVKSFDMSPCRDSSIDDIDVELFKQGYLPKAVDTSIIDDDNRDIKDQLASLRLFDKLADCPTNAGMLLLGKNVKAFLPGAYIQHVQFDGLDNSADIINQNEFSGNLISMLPRLQTFVEIGVVKKRPVAVSSLTEKIVSDYPEFAIRELLMNAVMHRDYQSGNTPTKFYMYSDRIEIVNPGGLFGNARPENFPDVNDYRNPIIAEALKTLGYVNKFNRGIARVQHELAMNGNGEAIFDVNKVTVFSVKVTNSKIANVSRNISNDSNNGWSESEFKTIHLSDKSLNVLGLCLESELTRKELLLSQGVTNQTFNASNIISPLLVLGLIAPYAEDTKKARGVRYIATLKGRAYYTWHEIKVNS